jgi:dTDP-4-dehydrorhamnose reductase
MTTRPLTILINGRSGQVAQALKTRLAHLGELHVLGRDQLDLTYPERIRDVVRAIAPDVIVNAAAYTAVDQAEKEEPLALAINGISPGVLAEEAARLNAPLIHYSSDYVFDGRKPMPYAESDPACPLSVYGSSKLAGERAISAVGGAHLILRTSWVFSLQGRNFLLTMQRLLQEKPELRIVADLGRHYRRCYPPHDRTLARWPGRRMGHLSPDRPGRNLLVRFCPDDRQSSAC